MKSTFMKKPTDMMIVLRKNEGITITSLANKTRLTFSYTAEVVNRLETLGIIKTIKTGRDRLVSLTDLGRAIATDINHLNNNLKKVKP